jgi:hypothetical protein
MIESLINPDGLAQSIIVAGAVVTALIVIARFVRRSVKSSYKFVRRLDLIHTTILQELLPNGGHSLKDQISRIDTRVTTLEELATGVVRSDDAS